MVNKTDISELNALRGIRSDNSDSETDPAPAIKKENPRIQKGSPAIPIHEIENEVKDVLSSLWSFKEILVEFQEKLHKDCTSSFSDLNKDFQEITRNIDAFHEDLRLKSGIREKLDSIKGIGPTMVGAINKISEKASRDESYLAIASKITPLINTYSDIIEKVSLLESNLENFFRAQKSISERKQYDKSQSTLAGSSAIIRSQEIERHRIAREIHDGPAQAIANIIFRLDIVQKAIERKPNSIPEEMSKVKDIAQGALNEIRHFIFDLRPMTLQDLGLTATLRKIIQNSSDKYQPKVELLIEGLEKELDPDIDLAIFRIAQESLNNIRKHAKASSAWVQLKYFDDKVVLIVEDNGIGFNLKESKLQKNVEYNSFGLIGMQERADDITGNLQITSQPMRGTKVIFTVPIG